MSIGKFKKIHFHFKVSPFYLPNRHTLKLFLESIFNKENKDVDHVNVIFCSDEELLEINRNYLKHDYFTDIITFDFAPKHQPILSDIFISIERVRDNASKFNTSFKGELHRVIFHGILHLCGYKDKTKADKELMRKKEDMYLKSYFSS